VRWQIQVFIHTRLSHAYLALARLSCLVRQGTPGDRRGVWFEVLIPQSVNWCRYSSIWTVPLKIRIGKNWGCLGAVLLEFDPNELILVLRPQMIVQSFIKCYSKLRLTDASDLIIYPMICMLHVWMLAFLPRDSIYHICLARYMLPSVRPSVSPSVTRVDHRKTVEDSIMKFLPNGSTHLSSFCRVSFIQKF